jgi:hypothetical protein
VATVLAGGPGIRPTGAGPPYRPGGAQDEHDGGRQRARVVNDRPLIVDLDALGGSAAPAEARQGRRPSASRKPRAARPLITNETESAK